MLRRFNYTDRRRIHRSEILIHLTSSENGAPTFDATFDFSRLSLPSDARVYVEAYYRRSYMRFDFGTVGETRQLGRRTLDDLDFVDRPNFRVKVVDEQSGRVLADANQIRPEVEGEQDRESLLPVRIVTDLGQQVWKVDFEVADTPVLELNGSVPEIRERARVSPAFGCVVWPAVVREILTRILLIENAPVSRDRSTWQGRWLLFGSKYTAMTISEDGDLEASLEWIDDAVAAFSEHLRASDRYSSVSWEDR